MGVYVLYWNFDVFFGYEELGVKDVFLGYVGIIVFDDSVDMLKLVCFVMEFCVLESCGKCMFCCIGLVWGVEMIDCIVVGDEDGILVLKDLCNMMKWGLICVLGGFVFFFVMLVLMYFFDEFYGCSEFWKEVVE